MKFKLGKLGTAEAVAPSSVATCWDFVMIFAGNSNRAQKLRLYASAIAVCVDKSAKLPKYPIHTGDPVAFGHTILDRLFEVGLDVGTISEYGDQCILMMIKKTNTLGGVEEKVNFSSPNEEASTS